MLYRTMLMVPVAVEPSAAQFVVGEGEEPQQVPREMSVAPPFEVTVRQALPGEGVMEVTVGS